VLVSPRRTMIIENKEVLIEIMLSLRATSPPCGTALSAGWWELRNLRPGDLVSNS